MSNTKKLKRAVIKEELVALTGNYVSAIILNQLIYWTERMADVDEYIKQENERAALYGKDTQELTHGWIYKKAEQLADETMLNMSGNTFRKYLKDLESAGFIKSRCNPVYCWDRTLQYRVDIVNVIKQLNQIGYQLEGYGFLENLDIKQSHDSDNANENISIQEEKNSFQCEENSIQKSKNFGAIPEITTETTTEITTDNKQTPPTAAIPDKSGESVTANDTLNATLRGSIASIDTSIASISCIKDEFEKLWAIYPNKQGKQHAYRAYERARKRKQNPVTYEQVKAGIEQYCEYIAAKGISKQYIKHGSTYFNGAEWESEYDLTPVQQYQPQTYQKPQEETKKWATAEGDHEPPEVIMGVMTIQEFAEQQPRSFAISYYEYYIGEQWAKEWADTHKEVLENAGTK